MNFRVGQKVVCVQRHPEYGRFTVPHIGGVYTIRGIDDSDGLLLEEVRNEPTDCFDLKNCLRSFAEPSFWMHRFRPLVERKTDISIFTQMLTPAPRVKDQTPCASS